jgi:peptidyl-prolyl cis-trans isomerase C
MKRLLREPLVHFLLLGAILFGVYAYMERGRGGVDQSKQIRLTLDDLSQLVLVFQSQWRRDPAPEEFRALVEEKVREEVLYREALALGLDKNDTIVMRRMAQKMQFLAEDVAAAREPTPAEIGTWFEANRDRVALPPRVSFRHLYFSPDRRGMRARDDATAALTRLTGQPEDSHLAATLADAFMFQAYPRAGVPGQGVRSQFRARGREALAGVVAGTDRVRARLASRVRRHADPRPRARVRGGRGRREERVARRAEDASVGEGVPGHAREIHGAATGAG